MYVSDNFTAADTAADRDTKIKREADSNHADERKPISRPQLLVHEPHFSMNHTEVAGSGYLHVPSIRKCHHEVSCAILKITKRKTGQTQEPETVSAVLEISQMRTLMILMNDVSERVAELKDLKGKRFRLAGVRCVLV